LDVRHLPFEHPPTYRAIRHVFIENLLPGLQDVVGPALPDLPATENAERTQALTALMLRKRDDLLARTFKTLQPQQAKLDSQLPRPDPSSKIRQLTNDDPEESRWDLVVWLLEGLLARDFGNKLVKPGARAGAPFYLYRLAQKLAPKRTWLTTHAVTDLQQVLAELTAEHTRERLQAYYGMGGDGTSINHITKALRPVDMHQNAALAVLDKRQNLPEPASLVVGEPYAQQEFGIRRAIKHWQIPVPWLMNWTDHLPQIRQAIVALRDETERFKALSGLDEEDLAGSLATNKDVYVGSAQQTQRKLAAVLQQLADLHALGGPVTVHVDLASLLYQLEAAADDDQDLPSNEADDGADCRDEDGSNVAEPDDGAANPAAPDLEVGRPGTSDPMHAIYHALDQVQQPMVRVAVLLRLLRRLPGKGERQQLNDALVALWKGPMFDGQGLFERLGVKPGIPSLTDAVLARAAGATPAGFRAMVDEAIATFDTARAPARKAGAGKH